MNILLVPDSFKGTYTAKQVAEAIAAGVEHAGGTAVRQPLADGGEGTVAALTQPLGLTRIAADTVDPWGAPLSATYGLGPCGTAVIETASASGYRTDAARNPAAALAATSYGTGLLIADAARRGASHIIVGAGGSASTDGGDGAVRAINERGGLGAARMTVLADVTTTFRDAARVFGPQKGADPTTVTVLNERLTHLTRTLPRDPSSTPGSGAAGGLAGALWSAFDARIVAGSEFILDACGFDDMARSASAVVVGEGRLDGQTASGKLIDAVARRVGRTRPVFAVVGSRGQDLGAYAEHFAAIYVASRPPDMRRAGADVVATLTGLPATASSV